MAYPVYSQSESVFESHIFGAGVNFSVLNSCNNDIYSQGRHKRHSNLTVRVLFLFPVSDGFAVRNDPHPQHGKTPITQGFAAVSADFPSVHNTLHFPVPHRLQHIHFRHPP